MNNKEIHALCEAVADISYIAGAAGYSSGDSRVDMAQFIAWGAEFIKLHEGKDFGIDPGPEYIDAITEYARHKIGL